MQHKWGEKPRLRAKLGVLNPSNGASALATKCDTGMQWWADISSFLCSGGSVNKPSILNLCQESVNFKYGCLFHQDNR